MTTTVLHTPDLDGADASGVPDTLEADASIETTRMETTVEEIAADETTAH